MANWFHLDHLGSLAIKGPDALAFAQAQFTADLETPRTGWRPVAWCDPKGRVICVMLARITPDRVDLVLPADMIETVMQRLPMFAIGRQVEIAAGGRVAGCLENAVASEAPAYDHSRGLRVVEDLPESSPERRDAWRLADIRCAMPWIVPPTSARHLPQELGLEALGALSYDKGCFPGQEVVARVHYLGKPKRRLDGLTVTGKGVPPVGSRLESADGRNVGEILDAIGTDDGAIALAVVAADLKADCEVVIRHDRESFTAHVTPVESLC